MKSTKNAPLFAFKNIIHSNETLFVNIDWLDSDEQSFSFDINQDCPLLEEHFPNFPIVPASLIIGFITQVNRQIQGLLAAPILIENVRFNLPLIPQNNYRCQFKAQASKGILFTISDKNNAIYTKGLVCAKPAQLNTTEAKNQGVEDAA